MASKFNYPRAVQTADRLITKFGMVGALRREGDSPEDRPCTIAIVEYRPREKPSDLANPTDRKVYMSALTPEVQAIPPDDEQDKLVVYVQPMPTDGSSPIVADVLPMTCKPTPLAPAGTIVFWEFTVRGRQ